MSAYPFSPYVWYEHRTNTRTAKESCHSIRLQSTGQTCDLVNLSCSIPINAVSTENWLRRMESNHRKLVYETSVNTNSLRHIAPFYFPTNLVGARDWNHGAESNCRCILSAACGSITAAHLLALQCRTAIVRPWYKCGAIFIQPLRVILFARRRRPQMGVPIKSTPVRFYRQRQQSDRSSLRHFRCACSTRPSVTMDGNRTRVCPLTGSRTHHLCYHGVYPGIQPRLPMPIKQPGPVPRKKKGKPSSNRHSSPLMTADSTIPTPTLSSL